MGRWWVWVLLLGIAGRRDLQDLYALYAGAPCIDAYVGRAVHLVQVQCSGWLGEYGTRCLARVSTRRRRPHRRRPLPPHSPSIASPSIASPPPAPLLRVQPS